ARLRTAWPPACPGAGCARREAPAATAPRLQRWQRLSCLNLLRMVRLTHLIQPRGRRIAPDVLAAVAYRHEFALRRIDALAPRLREVAIEQRASLGLVGGCVDPC